MQRHGSEFEDVGSTGVSARAMPWYRHLSIGKKMLLQSIVTMAIAVAMSCAIIVVTSIGDMRSSIRQKLSDQADLASSLSVSSLVSGDRTAGARQLTALTSLGDLQVAALYDSEGRAFAARVSDDRAAVVPDRAPEPGSEMSGRFFGLVRAIRFEDQQIGTLYLRYNASDEISALNVTLLIIIGSTILAWLLSSILLIRNHQQLLGPVSELVGTAERVSRQGRYDARARKFGNDELGRLTDTFNQMLERIERQDSEVRQAREDLERRVHERTQELQIAHEHLVRANSDLRVARDAANVASMAKSSFLANMSHEIRTPMTAILGYAELLDQGGHDEAESRHCIDTIRRNGEHLMAIVNDVLDLSKIEAGRMSIEPADVCPARLVSEVLALLRVRADAKGIDLGVEYRSEIPRSIRTDEVRLRQILMNLVGNAIKFTDRGSVLVEVSLEAHRGTAPEMRFDVVDTGIGMNDEQVGMLFQPFAQADATMARRFGGTGLGLSISQRLARLLGGTIDVTSRAGVGSRFVVTVDPGRVDDDALYLPGEEGGTTARAAGVRARARRLEVGARAARILVAEDGPDNQRLIAHHLRRAGAEVDLVDNGLDAVERLVAGAFDCVLMDMQMPKLDGYQATRRIRGMGLSIPVIALTAHAMAEDRRRCLDAGCDDYASKPIDWDGLIDLCASYLTASAERRAA